MKRRHFLQFTGSALGAIGLSQLDLLNQANRYGRVLAQSTPRKLALLVGINDYSPQFDWPRLRGCVTDVQMQRELLVHRFGFIPDDILTLTDGKATREGILSAFQEHLIAQAKPGDVVVFHYSGHGSRVVDPNPYRDENPLNSTFVPIDSPLPENYPQGGGNVNDIMGKTLFLLMRQLDTEQVTVVLDSCYSGGGKRGAVTFRSREGAFSTASELFPSEGEQELQTRLQASLNLSDEELFELRQQNIAKGVVISSAAKGQLAADAFFNGFYAGAFTYLLTQYLWQQTGDRSLSRTFVDIDRATRSLASTSINTQDPEFEVNLPPDLGEASIYFTPKQSPPAEAVVLETEGDRLRLWLGGVHPDSLRAFQTGAVFTAVNPDGSELGKVQLTADPEGLEAVGTLVSGARSIPRGNLFLQEEVRTVPEGLALRVGIDPSLEGEREAAQQALAGIDRIETQPPGSDDVDYFIGRLEDDDSRFAFSALGERPPSGSIVLLYPELSVIPNSWGAPSESAADAVARLRSKFRVLLATRIIRSIVNPGSSDLRVAASIDVLGTSLTGDASNIGVRGGSRGLAQDESEGSTAPVETLTDASRLPLGTTIQIQVENQETRPINEANGLYVAALAIDSSGDMTILYPTDWSAPDLASFIESEQTIQIPDPDRGDRFNLVVSEPVGVTEILIIASAVPLRRTLAALSAIAIEQERRSSGSTRGLPLSTPEGEQFVDAAGGLLDDLDGGARGITQEYQPTSSNVWEVNSRQLTALSITFEAYDPEVSG